MSTPTTSPVLSLSFLSNPPSSPLPPSSLSSSPHPFQPLYFILSTPPPVYESDYIKTFPFRFPSFLSPSPSYSSCLTFLPLPSPFSLCLPSSPSIFSLSPLSSPFLSQYFLSLCLSFLSPSPCYCYSSLTSLRPYFSPLPSPLSPPYLFPSFSPFFFLSPFLFPDHKLV